MKMVVGLFAFTIAVVPAVSAHAGYDAYDPNRESVLLLQGNLPAGGLIGDEQGLAVDNPPDPDPSYYYYEPSYSFCDPDYGCY